MSKGGSTTSTVAVPEYIEKAARRNLTEADKISKLGFIPEYGPTVAAFTPMQEAAFQGTADLASAFGTAGAPIDTYGAGRRMGNIGRSTAGSAFPIGMSQQEIFGGMPEPTTYAGGVRGYSALPIYEQALEAFGQARPGQKQYIDSFFIDPFTGAAGSNMQAPVDYTVASTPGDLGGIGGGGGDDPYFPPVTLPVTSPVTPPVTPPVITPVAPGPVYGGVPTSPTDGAVFTSTDFSEEETPYTIVTPTDVRPPGYVDNTPSTFPEVREYYDSSPLNPSAPAVLKFDDGTSVDLGYDLGPSVAGGRGTIVPGQTTDIGLFTGGGADRVGNFGQVGDFFGGIGDALGITDYSGTGGGLLGGLNVTGPPVENKVTSYSHSTDNDRPAGPGDTGYEQDRYLEALQSGGTGIIYKDDRREVYLDGVLIGNPKSADSAEKMLAKAKEKKAAASKSSSLPVDTSTSAGSEGYVMFAAPAGMAASGNMEVRALSNGTEYYVDAAGNFAGLK